MFSTDGGLYQRAQKQFKIPDGKKLFMYSFYEKQKLAAMVRRQAGPAPLLPGHSCAVATPASSLRAAGQAAQAFYAEIHMEAKKATPGPGHRALAALARSGKLQRQYTLNIDGLSLAAGMPTWHMSDNPTGVHVRMPSALVMLKLSSTR